MAMGSVSFLVSLYQYQRFNKTFRQYEFAIQKRKARRWGVTLLAAPFPDGLYLARHEQLVFKGVEIQF
jgi:hypothetical protein